MKRIFLMFSLLLAACSACAQSANADNAFRQQVNAFLDEWHDDAAHARMAYFDKIAADGVYIGTDKSERWVRDDFKRWAKPYFSRPVAWAFHATKRNVAFSDDKAFVWFDEQLDTQMGICQASGVIRNGKDGLHIEHYQLSLTVPNDLVDQVTKEISAFDAKRLAK
jgi:hypothetical protein